MKTTRRGLFGFVAGLAGLAVLGKGQPPAPRFEPVLWPAMKAASEINRARAAWGMAQTTTTCTPSCTITCLGNESTS